MCNQNKKDTEQFVHASCVAIDNAAVMFSGGPGSGKSDLALRLIDRGAVLVSDDIVRLTNDSENILANSPLEIAGKIEVRSLGICNLEYAENVPLLLKVQLNKKVNRMPVDSQIETILGKRISTICLDPWETSAPIKVEWALARIIAAKQVSPASSP